MAPAETPIRGKYRVKCTVLPLSLSLSPEFPRALSRQVSAESARSDGRNVLPISDELVDSVASRAADLRRVIRRKFGDTICANRMEIAKRSRGCAIEV